MACFITALQLKNPLTHVKVSELLYTTHAMYTVTDVKRKAKQTQTVNQSKWQVAGLFVLRVALLMVNIDSCVLIWTMKNPNCTHTGARPPTHLHCHRDAFTHTRTNVCKCWRIHTHTHPDPKRQTSPFLWVLLPAFAEHKPDVSRLLKADTTVIAFKTLAPHWSICTTGHLNRQDRTISCCLRSYYFPWLWVARLCEYIEFTVVLVSQRNGLWVDAVSFLGRVTIMGTEAPCCNTNTHSGSTVEF